MCFKQIFKDLVSGEYWKRKEEEKKRKAKRIEVAKKRRAVEKAKADVENERM